MKAFLKSLTGKNFKGMISRTLDFTQVTNIHGKNRSGKTTAFDLFLWILFGKDSSGKTDFEVKTLDSSNRTLEKIEVSGSMVLLVDDQTIKIERVLREKWVKKRGSEIAEFSGNETIYNWNDVPLSQNEFNQKRGAIINEDFFRLLTDPSYFNNLPWQKQRQMLTGLIEQVSSIDLLELMDNKTEFLINTLNSEKTIEEAKKELAAKIKIQKVEYEINDKSKVLASFNEGRIGDQEVINNKALELSNLESKLKQDHNDKKNELETVLFNLQSELRLIQGPIDGLKKEKEANDLKINEKELLKIELLKKLSDNKKETFVFDPEKGICPSCKQTLQNVDEIKTDLIQNFEDNKAKVSKEISTQGHALVAEVKELINRSIEIIIGIDNGEQEVEKLKKEIETQEGLISIHEENGLLENAFRTNEHEALRVELSTLKEAFDSIKPPTIDTSIQAKRKIELTGEIDIIKSQLLDEKRISDLDVRIQDLKNSESKKSQEIAKLERDQFSIENFEKIKTEHIEKEVNKLFSFVQFKMFEHQINGGTKEVCKAMFNGVTYNSLNNEARINAGLDIINIFSKHYDFYAPVWVDNREGVTDIIEVDTQVINLIVDPSCEELTIK
jgi:hypothetical protein